MENKSSRIGIAFSGGGAKGIAHIGVLKALLENGIVPDVVSGTSAGSIMGAMYAAGRTTDEMETFIKDTSIVKIFRLVGMPGAGLVRLAYLKERLAEFLHEDSFEALKLPLFVCATNLNLGKAVFFSSGPLYDIVIASCSVPWLFKPVEIGGSLYADGGIVCNLPATPIRPLCDMLIGSNVKPKVRIEENKELQTFVGISQRVADLGLWTNSKPNIKLCDVYIASEKVNEFSFFNLRKTKELVDIGYEAAMEQMPKLLKLLKQHNGKELLGADVHSNGLG